MFASSRRAPSAAPETRPTLGETAYRTLPNFYRTTIRLSTLLDVEQPLGRDYRAVLEELGFQPEEVRFWGCKCKRPTLEALVGWGGTVQDLADALRSCERYDALGVLVQSLVQTLQEAHKQAGHHHAGTNVLTRGVPPSNSFPDLQPSTLRWAEPGACAEAPHRHPGHKQSPRVLDDATSAKSPSSLSSLSSLSCKLSSDSGFVGVTTELNPALGSLNPALESLNPYRESLNPSLESLNPSPESLNPSPESLDPSLESLNPSPESLNPSPESLYPSPESLYPSLESLNPSLQSLNPTGRLLSVPPVYPTGPPAEVDALLAARFEIPAHIATTCPSSSKGRTVTEFVCNLVASATSRCISISGDLTWISNTTVYINNFARLLLLLVAGLNAVTCVFGPAHTPAYVMELIVAAVPVAQSLYVDQNLPLYRELIRKIKEAEAAMRLITQSLERGPGKSPASESNRLTELDARKKKLEHLQCRVLPVYSDIRLCVISTLVVEVSLLFVILLVALLCYSGQEIAAKFGDGFTAMALALMCTDCAYNFAIVAVYYHDRTIETVLRKDRFRLNADLSRHDSDSV